VTYHDQLRYTFRLGSGIFLCSAILFAAMIGAKKAGYVLFGEVLLIVALVVLAVAALMFVAGLVGRSAHRWVWFNIITRSTRTVFGRTASQRLLDSPASPILRFWLHLDLEGKDRDGRVI